MKKIILETRLDSKNYDNIVTKCNTEKNWMLFISMR